MDAFKWNEEDWKTLVFAIQQNDCILILGPDIATEVVGDERRMLTEILSEEMAGEIDVKELGKINTSDLAQVAQYYCKEKGRMSLKHKVSSFYENRKSLNSDLHRIIADLPFYFIVTTTHDNMLINAMKEKGRKPVMERYHFRGENPEKVAMGTVEKPLFFYLYGSVDESDSLVLTENDLLDFLVALTSNKRPMAPNVLSEIQNEDKCFLFLGVGFRHWYQRILLYVLQMRKKDTHSFAMEEARFIPGKQIVFFFRKSDYKINILGIPFSEFAEQLQDRLSTSISTEKYKKGPQVFICHDHKDQEYASWMYEKFKAAGLRPWLDKEKLRGGDLWDNMIRDTIKEVDYVVVLQSKSMLKRVEGYVFAEINCALERQTKFKLGFRFIIPVIIDKSPLLKELASIQSIKMTDKKNIKSLISAIKDDFKARRAQ